MTPPNPYARTSWFFKFCTCLLSGIALLNLLMIPLEVLPPASFWETYGQYFQYLLQGMVAVAALGSGVYTYLWQRSERTGSVDSGLHHAWMQGILRYWLALSIATYGFAKILKTQFQSPDFQLDMPLGEVNGFGLTWYYFGYSYTLAVIIACFQIGGSMLLLYRRTTLLGVMVLLPVMVNIVLINLFYNISMGALYNSVVFTLGLMFLLLLDVHKLKAAFWDLLEQLPAVPLGGNWVKHGLRMLLIAAAFAMIEYFVVTDKNDKLLKGTWNVEKLTRNGQVLPATAWLTDRTAWSRVYFAGAQGCVFSPNPYRYRPEESLQGSYQFDSLRNHLQAVVYGYTANGPGRDTLRATISGRTATTMRLHAFLGKDTLDIELTRLR